MAWNGMAMSAVRVRRLHCTSAYLLLSAAATSPLHAPRTVAAASSLASFRAPTSSSHRPAFIGSRSRSIIGIAHVGNHRSTSIRSRQLTPSSRRLASAAPSASSLKMSTSADGAPSYKRAKLSQFPPSTKTIGTHSGTFQADEALGVWLLRQLPLYRRSPVVRSRDPEVLSKCDIVIDVGGIYDHEKLRYDHHQRGYDERFPPKKKGDGTDEVRCTKLSASGLVYRHYGKEVIAEHYPDLKNNDTELEWVYEKVYDSFMEAIDAIDTGVEPVPPAKDGEEAVELQYKDGTGLSARVGRTNPRWNEVDETTGAPPDPDARFEIASAMCGEDFLGVLTKVVESDLPACSIVESAVKARLECDPSGEIIKLPSGGLPWKSQVYELEKEHKLEVPIKYVLYTDQAGMWRVQCVSVEGKAFENRLGLPESWRGVRDEDLSKVAGIEGCTFCHASGFIGGNRSYEGVLEMARAALKVG